MKRMMVHSWLAKNKSGKIEQEDPVQDSNPKTNIEEHKFLIENATDGEFACEDHTAIKSIDWELVKKYSNKTGADSINEHADNKSKVLEKLGFFAKTFFQGKRVLRKDVVSCFCKNPEKYFSMVCSKFVIKREGKIRPSVTDIYGPLSNQIEDKTVKKAFHDNLFKYKENEFLEIAGKAFFENKKLGCPFFSRCGTSRRIWIPLLSTASARRASATSILRLSKSASLMMSLLFC